MVLFVWCCFGVQNANAQIVTKFTAKDTTCTVSKLATCNGEPTTTSTRWTDDGTNDGNYADPMGQERRDTTEICPTDAWHRVKVVFTDFDLEANDSLVAFQGKKSLLRGPFTSTADSLAKRAAIRDSVATGTGTSAAFGAWIEADCNAQVNASGCLTFIFYTNGQNSKGRGWDAWVDCSEKKVEFGTINIPSRKLTCDSSAYGVIPITVPSVKACGVNAAGTSDSVIIRITNQRGDVCIDTCLSNNAGNTLSDTFAIGSYLATYKWKFDTAKVKTAAFSVQAPSLICNDDIEVPLGSACMIQLTPDDLLENPCDTMTDTMYYNITVTLGTGKNAQTLKTTGFADGNAVVYPVITTADLKKAGMTVCNATASVTVERIYYGRAGTQSLATICNNGAQNASCTTTLRFNDQSKPFITLAAGVDTLVACDTTGLGKILNASAIDNCDDELAVTYTVTITDDPCFKNDSDGKPDTTIAVVNFRSEDDCGNVGTLSKNIVIIRPNENDHLAKGTNLIRDCKDTNNNTGTPGLKIGTYQNSMFNVVDTIDLSTDKYICGYILTKRDVDIPATDCGRKLYRYWSITDWCSPEIGPSVIDTTFIEYTDTSAPKIVNEIGTYTTPFGRTFGTLANQNIDLGPFECTFDLSKFTKPGATDNCDDNPTVRIDSIFRIEDGLDWGLASGAATVDCDSFRIKWVASDQCHEQRVNDTSYQIVVVRDVTKPSAICTDELNVSLPGDAGAKINWKDIDAGSFDGCGIKVIEIRRKGTNDAWGPDVTIVCEDVHVGTQIEMRVTDNKGNTNICWTNVIAEDKIAPICNDLPDMSRTCDQFTSGELGADTGGEFVPLTGDLLAKYNAEFGNPACADNLTCGIIEIEQEYKLTDLNCGALAIERRYTAKDWADTKSNVGTQKITVTYKPDWKLTFPGNVELTCGGEFPAASTAAEIIDNGSCDLWALEVTEQTFDVPGDICFELVRTYELINWCVYKAGDPAVVLPNSPTSFMITSEGNETVGRYVYTQRLMLEVDEAPSITIAEVEECITGEGDAAPYGVEDITPGAAPFECDELRTFTASGTNCLGLALPSSAFSWKFFLNGTLAGEGTGSSFTRVVSAKSKYKVEFTVGDGCSNSATAEYEVEFKDCKRPTPYVLNGLAVEIMQTGMIQLWATDLDQGSFDNCTPKDKLDIRIGIGDPTQGPQDLAGVQALGKVITLTCDNLGTQSVSIYVLDECDNWDVVGTYVLVQNNMGACSPTVDDMGVVAGTITNATGENVELVNVSVNGGDKSMATGASGAFSFELELGGDYTITPEKNINPLNGVSTYDLVLISKHILGITPFDSPYKYIAADVNKSGSITAFDMVQLRQLILNITSEFPNNSSWRFVDAKHEFSTANPAAENFNEFMNVNNLDGQMADINFVAAKIGDVNGNATANSLMGAESRSVNGTFNLNVADRFVEAGEIVTVDFKSTDMADVAGYQFTLNTKGAAEIAEGVAKAANFNVAAANRGSIATSWNGEATADEVLFSVTFTANASGLLSELVSVSSDMTSAEAYNTAGELMDVNIDFDGSSVSNAFGLSQNTPNPFNGETVIGFNLPEAGKATLSVMDVQGKVLSIIERDGVKGYNQVTINAKTLGATGVLYYQLESANNIATKKMIIIE